MARDKSELKSGISKTAGTFTALIEAVEVLGDTHRVTVDRDKKLKAMIEVGCYDWTNSDITDKHFPVKGSGAEAVEIILRHYDKVMSKGVVLADLLKNGLRPIRIEELLALGANEKTRDLQREFPIIALGSVWRYLIGNRDVPCLDGNGSNRVLVLNWVENDWPGLCRFGAVRQAWPDLATLDK